MKNVFTVFAVILGLAALAGLSQKLIHDWYQSEYLSVALLSQAMARAQPVKMAVAEFYANRGQLPKDNRALGLGAPDTFAERGLKSMAVRNGHIVISFDDSVGEDATLVLRVEPSRANIGSPLKWACETTTLDVDALAKLAPQCVRVETIVLTMPPVKAPEKPSYSTQDLVSALHHRRRSLTRRIIAADIDVNQPYEGMYPLQIALDKRDSGTVSELLRAGADPNLKLPRYDGMTMLTYASATPGQRSDIIRELVRAGGRLEARDDKGRTPLMHAARKDNSAAIDVLLKAGASLDTIDNQGHTAFEHAAITGRKSSAYRRLTQAKRKRDEIIVIIPERD